MPHRPNEANGHIVKSPSMTVWVVGDTSLYDEMRELPEIAGAPIDLAIVPIGGWGARLSEGHMGPKEAAVACSRVGARAALAVHWGTLHVPLLRELPRGWMDKPGDEFAKALAKAAPDCQPHLPDARREHLGSVAADAAAPADPRPSSPSVRTLARRKDQWQIEEVEQRIVRRS